MIKAKGHRILLLFDRLFYSTPKKSSVDAAYILTSKLDFG